MKTTPGSRSFNQPARLFAILALTLILGSFLQATFDWPYRLRLANPPANYWAVAIGALLVPVILLWLFLPLARQWVRRTGMTIAFLLAVPCLLISNCAALEAPSLGSSDSSYELISEVQTGSSAFRLYRTNCGATCAFGLDLREERDLFGGLKVVSSKWGMYRASAGELRLDQASVLVVEGGLIVARIPR